MQREMIGEIESHQPEYLVWVGSANSWAVRSTSGREIFEWFNQYSREFYEITGLAAVRPDRAGHIFLGR